MRLPATLIIDIRLDSDPRYAGSTHDDATARRLGFRAALVPGAFIYGHVSRLAVDAWGMDWLARGAIGVRFRRPAHDGDRLTIAATAQADDARVAITVRNDAGEEIASGWIAPPCATEAPNVETPGPLPRPKIDVDGGLVVGARAGSRNAILDAADLAASRAAFQETHPIYTDGILAHPGCPMRLAMGDVNQSFALPSPPILASVEGRHFGVVRAGQRIATAAEIVDVYERKGRRYFVSDEIATADGVAVARYRRAQALA